MNLFKKPVSAIQYALLMSITFFVGHYLHAVGFTFNKNYPFMEEVLQCAATGFLVWLALTWLAKRATKT
jgi:hypothetical protein